MLKASNSAKIELGLRYWRIFAAGAVILLLLLLWPGFARAPATGKLLIKNQQFTYETADTPAQQAKGLGGRGFMVADHAMLFRFPATGKQCFWMKDMRFNLDIIWVNQDRRIVHIEPNLSPDTYPQSYCADNTQYVVETNAGVSQQLNLKIGDTVTF